MKKLLFPLLFLATLTGCTDSSYSSDYYDDEYYQEPSYDDVYEWAEDEDIQDFADCQDTFGTGDAEDGCNEYVKDNYTGYKSFGGYPCTEDCSGHEAGYEWAEENDITDTYDCEGNSDSFVEGCEAYVEENEYYYDDYGYDSYDYYDGY